MENLVLAEVYNGSGIENISGFKFYLKNINMAVITPTQEILSSGLVKKIHPLSTVESRIKNAREHLNADFAYQNGITGKGVTVAVLDTGLSPMADFSGRIVTFKDFINGKKMPYDDNGHGTHVRRIKSEFFSS